MELESVGPSDFRVDRVFRQPGAPGANDGFPIRRTELAHRTSAGIDVTLMWVRRAGRNEVLVCVCDQREGAYFEIEADPYLALDIYYHPYSYRDFSTVDYEDDRLAA